MLLHVWWLFIPAIISGIVFPVGPIPVCRASHQTFTEEALQTGLSVYQWHVFYEFI